MRTGIIRATGLVVASDLVTKSALLALDAFIIATLAESHIEAFLIFTFWIRFAPYCGFGTNAYLNKTLPPLSAPEDRERVIGAAARLALLLALAYALGGAALFAGIGGEATSDATTVSLAVAVVATALIQIMTLQQTVSRGVFAFPVYALSQSLQALAALGLGLALIPEFGLVGLYGAFLCSYLVAILAWFATSRHSLALGPLRRVPARVSLEPVRRGGWFFLLGVAIFGLQSLDRLAAVVFGDIDVQVSFGVGFLFYQLGIICVNSVGKVATPLILARQSRTGGDDGAQAGTTILLVFCAVVFALCLGAVLFGLRAVPHLIPERFFAARGVVVFYMAAGFLTALGLSFVPLLLKRSKEALLLILVIAIGSIVIAGLFAFGDALDRPAAFATLSLAIAFVFTATTIALAALATEGGTAPDRLALRCGAVIAVTAAPFIAKSLELV